LAPGKNILTPVDRDPVDIEQAFVAATEPVAGGTLIFQVGRQLIAFDLQRVVSLRDGPNLHQRYDAARVEYQRSVAPRRRLHAARTDKQSKPEVRL